MCPVTPASKLHQVKFPGIQISFRRHLLLLREGLKSVLKAVKGLVKSSPRYHRLPTVLNSLWLMTLTDS